MMVSFGAKPKIEQIGNILKVSGIMMKVGEWTPSDGTKTTFDKNSIAKLYSNITDNLPLWVTHDEAGISCRSPNGFSYKAGLVNDDQEIAWEGLVFEKSAIDDIIINGFDGNSIEVDLDLDENGLVTDGHIIGNAFVKDPAVHDEVVNAEFVGVDSRRTFIDGTTSIEVTGDNLVRAMFDIGTSDIIIGTDSDTMAIDDGSSSHVSDDIISEENMTGKISDLLAGLSEAERTELRGELRVETSVPPVVDTSELDEALGMVTALEAENADFKAQFEAMHKKKFESLVEKLVEFGIEDPAAITEGLDTKQGVEVLSKFQEKLVKEKPAVTTGDLPAESKDDRGANFEKLVKDEGLEDMVEKFLNGGK